MKKNLLFIALLVMSCSCTFATHLMGGQMTSRNIGNLTYEVTLTAYRDTMGVPMTTLTTFYYTDLAGTWTQNNMVYAAAAVNFGNGVEEYVYTDTITFPAAGNYDVWYEDCCRNCALLNLANPCGESFHLHNTLLVDPTNSSPVFLNPPIPIAQLNVAFNYNPLPFDLDGDSLVWALDTPLTTGGAFVTGYTIPSSDPGSPFTMNTATGEISFLPNLLGYFEVSVLVSEYRGGFKIGEIRRDMQIIVINSLNSPVIASGSSNTFPYSGKSYTITPGNAFTLSIGCVDNDNNTVNITAHGEPLVMYTNPATFTVVNTPGQANGTFSWMPDITQGRDLPYIVALRLEEDFGGYTFESDITYSLRVGTSATAIAENLKADGINAVYPNPSKGNFAVELTMQKQGTVALHVRSLTGQQMAVLSTVKVNAGVNLIDVNNLKLANGKYFVSVEQDGKVLSVKAFEIAK